MSKLAIEIKGLQKNYLGKGGKILKTALKGIDLSINEGAFFGLLGPNGAGKSTIINIMAGLVDKTAGEVKINGYDIDTQQKLAKYSIGIVPQELVLDTFFTVREALDIHAGYYGVPKSKRRTDEIINVMGLSDKADAKSRSLSGGMRRRLLIAKALVHSPKILVLDEPTAGVDIELRTQLWEYIRKLNKAGTTILLTTHYLEEAEVLCDEIAIINHGEVVTCQKKDVLMRGFNNKQLLLKLQQEIHDIPSSLKQNGWRLLEDGRLRLDYQPSEVNIGDVLQQICEAGFSIADISTKDTELEQIFLHFTSNYSDLTL
jgi:ABC-2 type transport system ATP-binding protein